MTSHPDQQETMSKAVSKSLSTSSWTLFVAALAAAACAAPALLLTWVGRTGHNLVGLAFALVLLIMPIGLMSSAIDHLRIEEAEVDAPAPFHTFWFLSASSLVAVLRLGVTKPV
jgi:hypothetical protein